RVALVPGASRFLPDRDRRSGDLLQAMQDVPDAGGLPAADIVDLAGQGVYRSNRGGDAIADIGVAAHLLSVAIDDDRPAQQRRLDEAVIAHIGPLARAVDGEVTQDDQRQPVRICMSLAEVLASELRHTVGRDRPCRQRLVAVAEAPINRGSGDVKETMQPWRTAEDRFQQALRGLDVAGPVAIEVGPALDEARLRSDMENDLGISEDRVQGVGPQVERVEAKAGFAVEASEVAALD